MTIRLLAAAMLLVLSAGDAFAQAGKLYRHVDEQGNVVFSDRPSKADQSPEKKKPANAASSEATRQYETERRELLRRRRDEALATQRHREAQERAAERERMAKNQSRGRRYDPNLPDSPPPDSERRYYYGR